MTKQTELKRLQNENEILRNQIDNCLAIDEAEWRMTNENGVFIQEQKDLTEEINYLLYEKPKQDKIKIEMREFLEGLK
jgi:hypothetical protein